MDFSIDETLIRLKAEFEHARSQFSKSRSTDDFIFYANMMAKKKEEIDYFEKLKLEP